MNDTANTSAEARRHQAQHGANSPIFTVGRCRGTTLSVLPEPSQSSGPYLGIPSGSSGSLSGSMGAYPLGSHSLGVGPYPQIDPALVSIPPSPLLFLAGENFPPTAVSSPQSSGSLLLRPEDSVSQVSLQPQALARPISGINSRRSSAHVTGIFWSQDCQTLFENMLGRLTTSAGLPLSWIDNPEFFKFCDIFIPAATLLSRKTLTQRIIPRLVNELWTTSKKEAAGKKATLQADGWTGENHKHLIAFMITADKKAS